MSLKWLFEHLVGRYFCKNIIQYYTSQFQMLQSRPERKRRQLPLQVLAVATQGDPEILKMTRGP